MNDKCLTMYFAIFTCPTTMLHVMHHSTGFDDYVNFRFTDMIIGMVDYEGYNCARIWDTVLPQKMSRAEYCFLLCSHIAG